MCVVIICCPVCIVIYFEIKQLSYQVVFPPKNQDKNVTQITVADGKSIDS